jgi:beta-lactamase class A
MSVGIHRPVAKRTTVTPLHQQRARLRPWLLGMGLLLATGPTWADGPPDGEELLVETPSTTTEPEEIDLGPKAAEARDWINTTRESKPLQAFLDQTIKALLKKDRRARKARIGVAVLNLPKDGPPQLAHWGGDELIYPASVVKFVYLMAAYDLLERGKLVIDKKLDRQLTAMIYHSSNTATQKVFRRVTGTSAGAELSEEDYQAFKKRRLAIRDWLQEMGIIGVHSIHPTYNGGGDLYGRDVQLLKDASVKGGIANREFANRQAMTATGTAKLLALLATDRALSPENSAKVRKRMQRDPKKQPYQRRRIAGGAMRTKGVEVYSKTVTWGPIYADAGIVHGAAGRQFTLAVYIDATPAYRGNFIAELSKRVTRHLLGKP